MHVLFQILQKMVTMMNEDRDQMKTDKTIETEWMMVAMVIDRLLLVVFFVLAFLMTLIIFVYHPNYDDNSGKFVDSMDPEFGQQKNHVQDIEDYEQTP